MQTPVPAIPTALPDVEVTSTARRTTPLAVVVAAGGAAPAALSARGEELTGEWLDAIAFTGRAGEVQPGPVGSSVRWVAGVGDGAPGQWRTAGAALTKALNARIEQDTGAGRTAERTLQVELPPTVGPEEVAELVCGLRLGGYRFVVTAEAAPPVVATIRLVTTDAAVESAVRRAAVLAQATALARDLANTPSNVKDPAWLARMAVRTAGKVSDVVVRDEKWLAEEGFGGVLAVGGGSTRPPRFVELSHRPSGRRRPHVVLVGKGITFDTGGISVKPAEGMHLMRTDMAGGAAVIAAVEAVARLGLDVRVTGLVSCAENHLSGTAYRPGDIVRHYGGRTTEVTNTDAEGRMVMADALAYAVDRLQPDLLVDVATLTGAMKISLGVRTGGVFASTDAVAQQVLMAGVAAGERWWRMPLGSDVDSVAEEFADAVHSDVADVRQCPPGPGGISAAMFLREFTGDLPWAHLDIAGPARADRGYDEVVAGATGFAARTLVELAASYA
ncbi:leucyl aminopeptidase family protein [Actinophytocola oryzae]|uniref:Probable cytosol aminopeptidase n=1 Tax=Actinophytocola oryzae TaxID=502181 RepID=A0A4R7VDA9_9PSEU|nr:leucyl aminopeptidase family protein [Actinophytocola oryzae]TDV47123.1 leucyl aminopeptidase [Actinophytocola oryzae]